MIRPPTDDSPADRLDDVFHRYALAAVAGVTHPVEQVRHAGVGKGAAASADGLAGIGALHV